MRGSELAGAMAVVVDRLVSAREGASAIDRAIEAIVDKIGRFGGKDATSYLEAYKSEMQMRNIPEGRRLAGFPRVVTSNGPGFGSNRTEPSNRGLTIYRFKNK